MRESRKRSIGHSNQRASRLLLRLLVIAAASVPPPENQVAVKHRGSKPLRPSVTGLCEGRLALAHCDCQSRNNHKSHGGSHEIPSAPRLSCSNALMPKTKPLSASSFPIPPRKSPRRARSSPLVRAAVTKPAS